LFFEKVASGACEGCWKSGVVYYPFGLTFNSYQRENGLANNFVKFQSQEHVDDLALNWDSFKWRNHQPDIGRFFNIDPLAEKYVYNSPYAFSENQVVAHRELEGLEKVLITASEFIAEQNQFGTVYNKNFKDAPEGRTDAKILNSKVETSNGYVLTKRTDETGNSDNMFEEMFQFFATGNDEHFDYSIIGSDTKSGSKIEGNIEDAEFSIEISIDKNVMTFTSQLSGGDIDKAYSIKIGSARFEVPGFTIGTLKADRKKGEVSTNKVSISFTIDEKGNAEFDRKNLEEKDKAESTVQR
jgi:RHS repeat-associated protein